MGYLSIDNAYKNNTFMAFKEIYCLEKVEGTSTHVQWSKGQLTFYSGGAKHEEFIKLFDHDKLTELFKQAEYPQDTVVRIHGEAYGGKIQAMSKTYGKDLKFIGFDVRIGDVWLDVPKAEDYCNKFGIPFVPYERVQCTEENINRERDRDSVIAVMCGMGEGHMREGIVIRPPFEVRMNNGARVIAKHKRDDFREMRTPRPTIVDPDKLKVLEQAEAIAEEWCVPMRLRHVLNKMTIDDIEPDMNKMGDIIKNMIDDIYREGKGEIIESREASKAIGTKTVQLFKEYLRKKNMGVML